MTFKFQPKPLTDEEIHGLRKCCDLIEQTQPTKSLGQYAKLNDALNALKRVIESNDMEKCG